MIKEERKIGTNDNMRCPNCKNKMVPAGGNCWVCKSCGLDTCYNGGV